MLRDGFTENVRQNKHLVAYVILFVFVVMGFLYLERLADQLEQEGILRAHENCMTNNETRQVIGDVLDVIAAERPEDDPDDLARREALRDKVDEVLVIQECPPPPER